MPKVIHFEIEGKDGKKLQSFYSGLFNWTVNADNPMEYGMVDSVEDGIGGGISASQDGKSSTKIYVEVDQIQPYLDRAVSMGGKVIMPRTVLPGMVTMAQFEDPEGNIVGLTEPGVPQA